MKIISLKNKQNVFVTPDSFHPFLLVSDSLILPFGKYPLNKVQDINNKYDVFQGSVAYNPYTGTLLHSIGALSYMALYKWINGQFVFDKEKVFSKVDYTLSGGNLIIHDTPRYAPTAITLTKDYIVSIERDEESRLSSTSTESLNNSRPFEKAPHTIFVYDYDLKLKKIVDVGIPVFRIASSGYSNDVYLVGVNPEFCIATLDLL